MFSKPHKKLKQVGRNSFIGECECGHNHNFKKNEINYQQSDASIAKLNSIFTCPECNTTYDGMFMNIKSRESKLNFSITGTLIVVLILGGLSFGGYKLFNMATNDEPKKLEDMTNKELKNYYKWQQKDLETKWENSPAFKDKD